MKLFTKLQKGTLAAILCSAIAATPILITGCSQLTGGKSTGNDLSENVTKYPQLIVNKWTNGKLVRQSEGGSEENWYTFVADASEEYIYFKFSTATSLYVYLYDKDFNQIGNKINTYADSGEVRYATRTLVPDNTYYIKVIPDDWYGHSGFGTYWIGFSSFPAQPETVINELIADTWTNGKLVRQSEGGIDVNWYSFVADASEEYIYFKFSTATDLYAYLYDEDLNQIGDSINAYAASGEVRYATRTLVPDNTYYIKVVPGDGGYSYSGYGSYWVGFSSEDDALQ